MLSCDLSWKNTVVQLMNHYSQRTNGATVTEKGCSVVWDYKDSDPVLIIILKEYGPLQVKDLIDLLKIYLDDNTIAIIQGETYVEVKPKEIGKGTAVNNILDILNSEKDKIDFILCIGDDDNDEPMYINNI